MPDVACLHVRSAARDSGETLANAREDSGGICFSASAYHIPPPRHRERPPLGGNKYIALSPPRAGAAAIRGAIGFSQGGHSVLYLIP